MFEGLFKPKFYSKCKSYARLIKMRLEVIQKKRNAMQKFLKNDIVDLLRSGLEYNAYGRAEGLLVEKNMSSCYELIAKFIGCISDHARDLCKERDCPDECKEAIPSLIYAAARFSDLPELRELRKLFTEKFGSSLEPYTSKEFVNKLRHEPPSKEMKIQLLHDLAEEFSIKCDNKALEQRLFSPPQLHEERPKHDPMNIHNGEKWREMDNDIAMPNRNEKDEKKDIIDASWKVQSSIESDDETSEDKLSNVSNYEVEKKRSFSYGLVPPPYVKETLNNKGESNLKKAKESSNHEPVNQKKTAPKSVRTRSFKPQQQPSHNDTVSDTKSGDNEKAMDMLLMHYSKKESPYTKSGSVRHVHPSLPDFDDFKAHITSHRGR